MANPTHCAHEGCNCSIPADRAARADRFCSDYCSQHNKPGHQAHHCDCGHPGCAK